MALEGEGEGKDVGAEERDRLLSMLPMRHGYWKPLFLYQGCWLPPQTTKRIMLVQAKFEPRPDDVILATCPKCGTTWLKALAFTVANRSLHPVAGNVGHPLLTTHPQDLVPFLELPNLEKLATDSPRLIATHMPLPMLPPRVSALGCRIVYMCRDPKDVLVSLWHFTNKVSKDFSIELDAAFELFIEGVSLYGPIWDHFLGYWKQSVAEPDRVLFLRYEEMIADPIKHVKVLAEFLHVPFTDEEVSGGAVEEIVNLCSFEKLKSLPMNSTGVTDRIGGLPMENSSYFRVGKVGDWANHLPKDIAEKLDCIVEEKLSGSALTFWPLIAMLSLFSRYINATSSSEVQY